MGGAVGQILGLYKGSQVIVVELSSCNANYISVALCCETDRLVNYNYRTRHLMTACTHILDYQQPLCR